MSDDFDDELDEDAFLAEWAEAEAATLDELRVALAEHRNQPPPQPDLADAAARARDNSATRLPARLSAATSR